METLSNGTTLPCPRAAAGLCTATPVDPSFRRGEVDPVIWQRRDMREALANRDIVAVYALLQRFGISQRAIAAKTGQSQSEISEILTRRRHVSSYNVLVRIAEGLGVPRGWLGLAYDSDTLALIGGRPTTSGLDLQQGRGQLATASRATTGMVCVAPRDSSRDS